MAKIYPGNGIRVDTVTGSITNIDAEQKMKESWKKMTDKQKKLYEDFMLLKNKSKFDDAQSEIETYGHNAKIPTKNKK